MTATDGRHARHQLDEVIHAPVRFSIVAALASVDEAEFAHVRDTIEVSDSVLSKQSAQLEAAGYLKARKGYVGKRPRTWLSLTPAGRIAYSRHLQALRAIADLPGERPPERVQPDDSHPLTSRTRARPPVRHLPAPG